MPKPVNIICGQKYNRLTVIKVDGTIKGRKAVLCLCDCGKEVTRIAVSVFKGSTKSCGCLLTEKLLSASKTHGDFGTELYRRWADMKNRCFNPKVKCYKYYGAKGITVCDEWITYEGFKDWAINHGYLPGLSLERMNINANYCAENCTWIPIGGQQRNTSRSHFITLDGVTMIMQDWCDKYKIGQSTVSRRLKLGWDEKRAITEPINKNETTGNRIV